MDVPGFKTILCPVDFDELSAHALRHASLLAGCGHAKVIAAFGNLFQPPLYFTAGRLNELRKQALESAADAGRGLRAFVNATLPESSGNVAARVVDALAADAILEVAASTSADLIVMGTHGKGGFSRWMLGSKTERILHESCVPLLTVRSAPRPIRSILVPIDGSEASQAALVLAPRWGVCFNAGITALYVHAAGSAVSPPDLCKWISAEARKSCSIRDLVRHGDPAEEILALASEEAFDLIVIGSSHKRSSQGRVLGTTTLRAVRHAPCPVLTMCAGGKVQ